MKEESSPRSSKILTTNTVLEKPSEKPIRHYDCKLPVKRRSEEK